MENVKDELPLLKSMMKGIAAQFGSNCEVVLHDLTDGYESTIVLIENNHVTNRNIGDCGSNLGLEVLRGQTDEGDRYNYITQTVDGKVLRSSSIYLKNSKNEVIGSVCINLDISELMMAENAIKSLTMHNMEEVDEVFVSDVSELLDHLLKECQKEIGKPVAHMTKREKKEAIGYLDKKGAFLVKKAGDKVCSFFGISKFTLYNYLDETRSAPEGQL